MSVDTIDQRLLAILLEKAPNREAQIKVSRMLDRIRPSDREKNLVIILADGYLYNNWPWS